MNIPEPDPKPLPPSPLSTLLKFNGPSRDSLTPAPIINISGGGNPKQDGLKYPLPDIDAFAKLLEDPSADIKDLNHQMIRLMGTTAILLLQESHTQSPSFARSQTASRVVDALRSMHMTLQEREKNLYKDRLDFDNPRLQYLIDGLWDLIEVVMKECAFTEDQINNFFLMLQSKLPAFEEATKKKINSVSFNAAKHGPGAERTEDAALISKKRNDILSGKVIKDIPLPPPPTSEDHA